MDAVTLANSARTDANPPAGLTPTLLTLWLARAGKWDAAHDACQDLPDPAGAWIHAWLHRDLGGYFLQLNLRAIRNDSDGWETSKLAIGKRLRAMRNRMRLTQRQLAELVGAAEGTVSEWERGLKRPSGQLLAKATALLEGAPA
jgi:DNA-binding XRE family transcriptional regulator